MDEDQHIGARNLFLRGTHGALVRARSFQGRRAEPYPAQRGDGRHQQAAVRFAAQHLRHHFAEVAPAIARRGDKIFAIRPGEEARQLGARGQRFFGESVKHWSSGTAEPREDTEHEDNYAFMQRAKQDMLDRYDRGDVPEAFVNQRSLFAAAFNVDHAYGDWRDAIAHIERLEAAGAMEVKCLTQYATLTEAQRMETMRQMGEKVIPHFRSVGAKGEGRRAAVV